MSRAEQLLLPGSELGVSDWVTLDVAMNQTFADVTLDPVAMEIDGQPHAHGFLTMSLLAHLMANSMNVETSGAVLEEGYGLNYGFNRMRLIEPIPLGARIRGHFRTAGEGASERGEITIIPIDVHIEIEGMERPAMVAEWLLAWRK
ncbi:MAG: MaoC family dehydratase [Alphaproteobacteria bacterium]|nr:MaoC family dehydratase [Rhodospirillaceae bacterium]MBT7646650.1 MaoC family dehydratase [Rhodospirillaceae bacterium]MDG2479250.1 MaoC family dehydratase [Alphaproteobacteria bacterium]